MIINEIIFMNHLVHKLEYSLELFSICSLLFYFKIIIHSFLMYLLSPVLGPGI